MAMSKSINMRILSLVTIAVIGLASCSVYRNSASVSISIGELNIGMDKIPSNVDRVGNMSSAAIPVLLDELNKNGKLHRGQKIVLSGFGAGLTYGACVVTW